MFHYVVTQKKSFIDLSQHCSLHLMGLAVTKRTASAQENAGKTTVYKIIYTPIMETIHTEDVDATPMQHQWRAPLSMSFVPVF